MRLAVESLFPRYRLETAALVGILLLAGILRLTAPGVIEFKRDEANLSQLVLDLVRGRSFPLLGISSSVGIPNSPMSVYIFALPYLVTSDPTLATQFVGLLNILAVLLTYCMARRYYGPGVALLAALLFAVSPWGIIYSRKIWAQNLLPPFVLMTLLTGLLGQLAGKRWAQWLWLPLLSVTAQIHYSALLLVIPVLYLVWVGRSRWTRAFFLSFIPAVGLAVPFILGIITADLPTVDELRSLAATSAGDRSITLTDQMIRYAALTIAGTEIHSLAGPQTFQDYLAAVPDVYAFFGLLAWGVLFSVLWLIYRAWKVCSSRRLVDTLLLLWFLIPIAVFSITWTELYPHYLILIIPAAYIILAVGVGDLWEALRSNVSFRRIVFAVVGLIVAAVLALQTVLWFSLLSFLANTHTPGGFGTPLQYFMPVREAILSRQPSQVLARLDGQFVGIDDETTVWNVLLYDVPSVRFLDDNTSVYPLDPAVFLSRDCDGGETSGEFDLRSVDEGCYQVSNVAPGNFSWSGYESLIPEAAFANGSRLIGYQWLDDSQPCLELVWTVDVPTSEDYMFAVHFVNGDGQEFLNADGLSWRGQYWRPGDIVVRRFCLSSGQAGQQSDIAGVNIGMYTFDGVNFHNVDLLDANGTPAGQTVSIQFNSGAET